MSSLIVNTIILIVLNIFKAVLSFLFAVYFHTFFFLFFFPSAVRLTLTVSLCGRFVSYEN